ncbi:MAG: outer membrane beta-barrel protein [Dichotomicrobium sp.]
MRRSIFCYAISVCALLGAHAPQPAAQPVTASPGDQPFEKAADRLKAAEPEETERGIALMPGVIVTPMAFSEVGYDSNPDKNFEEDGAPFVRTGAGVSLSAVGERTLVNLNAVGSWQYFGAGVDRRSRLKGTVEGKVIHMLAPGLSLQAGGLFENDEFSFNADRTAGAFTELGYQDSVVATFLRGRFTDVQYQEFDSVSPDVPDDVAGLYRTSSFDAQRAEVGSGILVGNKNWWGLYGEVNAADVNYTNQPLEEEVDRDADDVYAKAGVRIVFSPALQGDFGMRWNRRELEDDRIDDFNSSYFDGNLTWKPNPFFSLAASIERYIGEPSATRSLLSDVKSYEVAATYLPLPGISLAFRAIRQKVREIGDSFEYDSTELNSLVTYQYSSRMQFYSDLRYQFFEQDLRDRDYERFRAAAGIRVIVDGTDPTLEGDLARLERLDEAYWPAHATFSMSAGYSRFELPEIEMGTVLSGTFFDKAQDRLEEHDGDVDGVRFNARLADFARHPLGDGDYLSFGLSGFYAQYEGDGRASCEFTETTDCAYVNIVDFDPEEENNTGPFGELSAKADRTLHYWGVSVDAGWAFLQGGGLKDGPAYYDSTGWKIGVGVRGLNERTDLTATDSLSPYPVSYDRKLDTHYFGGFVGFEDQFRLEDGWMFSFDIQGGVYRVHSEYEGRYAGYVLTGDGFIREWGSIDDEKDSASVIAGVQLGLGRQMNWGGLELYGQAEYLSFVPTIRYNNTDEAGGSPFGIQGSQNGTRISSDDGMNYTVGLRVSF